MGRPDPPSGKGLPQLWREATFIQKHINTEVKAPFSSPSQNILEESFQLWRAPLGYLRPFWDLHLGSTSPSAHFSFLPFSSSEVNFNSWINTYTLNSISEPAFPCCCNSVPHVFIHVMSYLKEGNHSLCLSPWATLFTVIGHTENQSGEIILNHGSIPEHKDQEGRSVGRTKKRRKDTNSKVNPGNS